MIEVGAVDFGQTVEQYGIPHYLKADIVGSETVCLRALLDFENKPDYLSIRSEKVIFTRLKKSFTCLKNSATINSKRFSRLQPSSNHIRRAERRKNHTFF
jgi:hypothetical protein